MAKIALGAKPFIYPLPVVLVGSKFDEQANFMAVAWVGIASSEPLAVSIAIRHQRHTMKGIRQSGTFSVNVPSQKMIKEIDYCGIASGANTDKVKDCNFDMFYGNLATAPMINQCPANLECRVKHQLNLGSHMLIIGEVIETYVSDDCYVDGKLDFTKVSPLGFIPDPLNQYIACNNISGKPFSIGMSLKQ